MCRKLILISCALVFCLSVVAQGAIVNRYSFTDGDTVAVDSISGRDGVLTGTAVIAGNQLMLDGGGTVELPGDILDPGLESVTIEAWFEVNAAQNWQRIFAFGETEMTLAETRYFTVLLQVTAIRGLSLLQTGLQHGKQVKKL